MAIAALLLVALVACADDGEGATSGPGLPEWLERVYPPPGAEVAAVAEIQVEHNATSADEQIRLLIDGTDVTVYSDLNIGELVYDLEDGRAPVGIEPGRHTATVERMRVPDNFEVPEDDVEVLDRFMWEFIVQ